MLLQVGRPTPGEEPAGCTAVPPDAPHRRRPRLHGQEQRVGGSHSHGHLHRPEGRASLDQRPKNPWTPSDPTPKRRGPGPKPTLCLGSGLDSQSYSRNMKSYVEPLIPFAKEF